MKVRACPSPRMFAQVTAHYAKPATQRAGDTSVVIAKSAPHVMPARAVNAIQVVGFARKSRTVGKGKKRIRRITY